MNERDVSDDVLCSFLSGKSLLHVCDMYDLLLVDVEAIVRDYIISNLPRKLDEPWRVPGGDDG